MRRQATTLMDLAGYDSTHLILTGQGDPVRLNGTEVSAGLFDVLGIRPALGRTFSADENAPGRNKVAIVGYGLWQQRAARPLSAGCRHHRERGPIGKKITLGWGRGPGTPRAGGVVVGIIGDVKESGLDA